MKELPVLVGSSLWSKIRPFRGGNRTTFLNLVQQVSSVLVLLGCAQVRTCSLFRSFQFTVNAHTCIS
jgi:hypothetical protein